MLLKDFYKVNSISTEASISTVAITINKDHQIFEGHFPDNPVTPGVCMMQIIKELTERIVGKKLFLQSSSNIKFMAIINPNVTPDLVLTLDISKNEAGYKVKNISKFEETVALKLTINFTKES